MWRGDCSEWEACGQVIAVGEVCRQVITVRGVCGQVIMSWGGV